MNRYFKMVPLLAMSLVAATTYAVEGTQADQATKPHHHMMHRSPFLIAVHQLGLSDAQRQSIHGIMEQSHTQAKAEFANHRGEFSGMLNPGDPNYANAVKAAENAAVAHIEQRSKDDTQIYNLLTPEQQTKLPQVLATMKEHKQQMHGHSEAK
jgi:Spy/CpxP family protein refolding chaperone